MKQCQEHCRTESKQNHMLLKEMTSHCKSAAIWDSSGHKGAFFLGELHYTESKFTFSNDKPTTVSIIDNDMEK